MQVKKIGLKSATAKRVAGKEPENIATPIMPFIQPFTALFIFRHLKNFIICQISSNY
jgi:hypothetical protein